MDTMDTNLGTMIDTILGTDGVGSRMCRDWGNNVYVIARQIDTCDYLTVIRREKLKAAFALIKSVANDVEVVNVNSPADIYDLTRDLMFEAQEHLVVLILDRRNHLLRRENLYVGNQSGSNIRMGEILRPAIVCRGSAIVIVHNHPSGDPTPSPDDVAVTRELKQACKLMDIDLLDSVVIGHDRYVSLKESGLGFS